VEVTPNSMTGITANSMLYVDAIGKPEVVPVVQVNRTSFIAYFGQTHQSSCTITQSSLANQQFRIGSSYPVFTVGAVADSGTLLLTLPWGSTGLTGQTYTIQLMYVMLANDIQAIIAMKDEQTGYPVRLHVPLAEADFRDPQRTNVTGNPWFSLVDRGANDQGNMTYELWPAPTVQRQFSYYYHKKWPELVKDTDRPPSFINPSILFYGALADAKLMRTQKEDPYYDPNGAQVYEAKFEQAVQVAVNADEAKVLTVLKDPWWNRVPGNFDTWQLSDPATNAFWSGGGGW
jgi:hypothetical protein